MKRWHTTNQMSFYTAIVLFSLCLISDPIFCAQAGAADELAQGQAYFRQGQYTLALAELERADKSANTDQQHARVAGALGLVYFHLQQDDKAERLLRRALNCKIAAPHEQVRWRTLLASLMLGQGKMEAAQSLFDEATAQAGNNAELKAGIKLQQLEMLPVSAWLPQLSAIQRQLWPLKPSDVRSSYLVRLAHMARKTGHDGRKLAYDSLMEAKSAAPPRLLAEIYGEIAQLYEDDRRFAEAFELNQTALGTIQELEVPELALELLWRQARIYRHRNLIPEAIAAYRQAIQHIESIRHDIPVVYRGGRSSFRETLQPVYQQLADLLLQKAKHQANSEKMPVLRQARSVVEQIKQAELEDFLGGRCAIQPVQRALLETVEPKTAILYPVILPDRLELLVSTGNEIQQFTQPITAKNLQEATYRFVAALRNAQPEVKNLSTPLYRWLITPIKRFLVKNHVQTIVIVPDGVLRLVPFGALYDGKKYLIEHYAVGTSPGLSIIEPSPLEPRQAHSLIVGLSEPGEVLERLPELILSQFKSGNASLNTHSRSRALLIPNTNNSTPLTTKLSGQQSSPMDTKRLKQLRETFRLPGVEQEIDSIKTTLPGTVLLNEAFSVERFRNELLNSHYAVVHIASHFVAGQSAASSFIMAHDDILNFDQINNLLRSSKFADQPIEMLTLSACQTAEGDDRAPLGLSGLAIKAKVRSALGTLWPVNDNAARQLMAEFYKAFNLPGISKAQAIRRAQLNLLAQQELAHPYFWAPYILVGNWL